MRNINKTDSKDSGININIPKEIAFLVLALFFSSGIMYYGVAPLYREAQISRMEVNLKNKNIESGKKLLSELSELVESSGQIDDADAEKIDNLISSKNNYEDYLALIVELASSKNIYADNFLISEEQKVSQKEDNDKKLKEEKISFSALGGFSNLVSFLQSLENAIPFIQEKSISISRKKQDIENEENPREINISPILESEISFKFYYL